MGWEIRGNHLYYYRKRRQGRRVISEYVGTVNTARLFSELDMEDRNEKLHTRAYIRRQALVNNKDDSDFQRLTGMVRIMVDATLLTAGYHPHKGQWRKRQYGKHNIN